MPASQAQYPSGSEPARDSGVSVSINGGCHTVIASRLAPTGVVVLAVVSSISCAAFSAIINVGEQVLPEMMRGMIEASATRKPGMP